MKVKSVQKIAAFYYHVETDQETFPEYRRSEKGYWERSMGEDWVAWNDNGALEKEFQKYLDGQPVFRIECFRPRTLLEDGIYHIEYIDDHQVRLTKKVSS